MPEHREGQRVPQVFVGGTRIGGADAREAWLARCRP